MADSFCKFMGSKSRLIEEIRDRVPAEFNNYHEPFIGTGSVFFGLYEEVLAGKRCFISDNNRELINCLRVIRESPGELLTTLGRMGAMFYGTANFQTEGRNEGYYYLIRGADRDKDSFVEWTKVERAARVIFLLKAGYNGRWRENSSGQHNIPIGDAKYKIKFAEPKRIYACSEILNNSGAIIGKAGFVTGKVITGDFVYLDPPYIPENPDKEFYNYGKHRFGLTQHRSLSWYCKALDNNGVKFLLSNSDTKLSRELYSKFYIDTVVTRRSINCKGESRGDKTEIMVRNYEP